MLEMASARARSEMATLAPMVQDFGKLLEGTPPGAWVAISADGERVLASSSEIKEVVRMALEAGEDRPLVIRVPAASSTFVF
jgi:hypothetical protein